MAEFAQLTSVPAASRDIGGRASSLGFVVKDTTIPQYLLIQRLLHVSTHLREVVGGTVTPGERERTENDNVCLALKRVHGARPAAPASARSSVSASSAYKKIRAL
jgi:hypothetical protein